MKNILALQKLSLDVDDMDAAGSAASKACSGLSLLICELD
jgi:hypothetical protein